MKPSFTKLGILTLVAAVAASPAVYAYLDPGTGSMLIQILIGFFAGLLLFFKNFWRSLFRRKKASDDIKN